MNDEIFNSVYLYEQVGYNGPLMLSSVQYYFSVTTESGFRIKCKSLLWKKKTKKPKNPLMLQLEQH